MKCKAKALYAGVILDPEAQAELMVWFNTQVDLLADVKSHHMTWSFKPTAEELASLPIGEEATLKVVGLVSRDGVQAVAVEGAASKNDIPHITVAVATGVSPVHSNVVLADGTTPHDGPTLKGRWGFFDGKQDCFSLGGA